MDFTGEMSMRHLPQNTSKDDLLRIPFENSDHRSGPKIKLY